MPVYDYRCSSCDCNFEMKQSFEDKDETSCPECGKTAKRQFIPVPVIFKGSGFYVTDHRTAENPTSNNPKPVKTDVKSTPSKPTGTSC
jgi:putative FmdB family regulatory protein